MHPLAESDPANHTEARQDTPAAEVVAFLADPEAALKPPRKSFAEWLGEQPEWTGPPYMGDDEEEDGPRPNLFAQAYAEYIRETWPERLNP